MPSDALPAALFVERETKKLKQHIAKLEKPSSDAPAFAQTLALEASDLTALHTGLVRHMTAWQCAHENAAARLTDMIARTDAILERIASKRH